MNELIDHTYLSPLCAISDIDRLCQEARDHQLYAVCVPPFFVSRAVQQLQGTPVKVATVIAFPYGYAETLVKVAETRRALDEGADELDIVINLSALKSGDWSYVRDDIDRVVTTARLKGKVSKLIIEISVLNAEERGRIVKICNDLRPDFVKTSTGTQGGATVGDVTYLRAQLHPEIRIKASGGIRTAAAARALIEAGANRIGTSSGVAVSQ